MNSKILLSDIPKKYPKLIKKFEKETGRYAVYHNKVTGGFKRWIKFQI